MFKHVIKKKMILAMFSILLMGVSAPNSKADSACDAARAAAVQALSEMAAACGTPLGLSSGACNLAIQHYAEASMAIAESCPVN